MVFFNTNLWPTIFVACNNCFSCDSRSSYLKKKKKKKRYLSVTVDDGFCGMCKLIKPLGETFIRYIFNRDYDQIN